MIKSMSIQDHTYNEWVEFIKEFTYSEILVDEYSCYSTYWDEDTNTERRAKTITIPINYDNITIMFDAETGKFIRFI